MHNRSFVCRYLTIVDSRLVNRRTNGIGSLTTELRGTFGERVCMCHPRFWLSPVPENRNAIILSVAPSFSFDKNASVVDSEA